MKAIHSNSMSDNGTSQKVSQPAVLSPNNSCHGQVGPSVSSQQWTNLPCVLFAALAVVASIANASRDGQTSLTDSDIRLATLAAYAAFVAFAFFQTANVVMMRPYPFIWRLLVASFASYGFFMTFLLCLPNKILARRVFRIYFHDIGEWTEYETMIRIRIDSVMGSCAVSATAIFKQIFMTPWFVSHSLGYMAKMFVLRNWRVAVIAGLVFELTEVSLMHFVPEVRIPATSPL